MLSFWERESFLHFDVIIVGGGITGFSLAAEILERDKMRKVLILERGLLPSGASTKNAGFACFGSLSELANDRKMMGEDGMLSLVESRWKGLQILRKRLRDKAIDFRNYGGYELLFHEKNDVVSELGSINSSLKKIFGGYVFSIDEKLVEKFGFSKTHVSNVIKNSFEGQIDTGKMMNALSTYVTEKGGRILTGANVNEINELQKKVEVRVGELCFTGEKVAICTNAFTRELYPELDIVPGRGQVLVTKPIKGLKIKGTFHFEEGYFYFRNFEERIIFGGGRNYDQEKESTTSFGSNEKLLRMLNKHLEEVIIPGVKYETDMKWSGIMAFGKEKSPIVKRMSNSIVAGVRMSGMGIALASTVAKQLADELSI